jgi:hypothetical protein
MAEGGAVPIQESVGAALASVRSNLRFVLTVSLIGAIVLSLVTGLALFVPQVGLLTTVGAMFVRAATYAAFILAAFGFAASAQQRAFSDGLRVWAAMAVVGFFMCIMMFVLLIPGMIALFSGPMAPYVGDLERAGSDQAAVISVMTRFVQEQPGALVGFVLFYAIVWILLTSRLFLAAPASVEAGRILTFETWAWTKGSMLRITAARLMLLGPAYILVAALDYVIAAAAGINAMDPIATAAVAQSNPALFIAYVFATSFITFALYSSLEAGLSTYLYRGLKPAAAQQSAA